MRRQEGFTLVELMVVIAIIGILAVTAVPFYQTFQQRAYGSEATLTMKSLVDGQIIYFLEHNSFYPSEDEGPINIPREGEGTPSPEGVLKEIEERLKVKISQNPRFEYFFENYGEEGVGINIRASFRLFTTGEDMLYAKLQKDGSVIYVPGPPDSK